MYKLLVAFIFSTMLFGYCDHSDSVPLQLHNSIEYFFCRPMSSDHLPSTNPTHLAVPQGVGYEYLSLCHYTGFENYRSIHTAAGSS